MQIEKKYNLQIHLIDHNINVNSEISGSTQVLESSI